MNRTNPNELGEMVAGLSQLVKTAAREQSPEAFETVEQQVNRFERIVREAQQARRGPEAKAAIRNLESGQALTAQEQEVIRSLVVGDAEYYLKHENNLKDWLSELDRLMAEVQRLATRDDDAALSDLRGVMKDAVRLVPNIRSYVEEKRRLDRFNAAFRSLDNDNRRLLVDLLREMLASPTR